MVVRDVEPHEIQDQTSDRDCPRIEDHCSELDAIAHRGRVGSTYLVSARNELSNSEIVLRLARLFGHGTEVVQRVPDRLGHDRRYGLDPTRLEQELGWRPRFPFDEALQRTVSWYREHPAWWTPLVPSPPGAAAVR